MSHWSGVIVLPRFLNSAVVQVPSVGIGTCLYIDTRSKPLRSDQTMPEATLSDRRSNGRRTTRTDERSEGV